MDAEPRRCRHEPVARGGRAAKLSHEVRRRLAAEIAGTADKLVRRRRHRRSQTAQRRTEGMRFRVPRVRALSRHPARSRPSAPRARRRITRPIVKAHEFARRIADSSGMVITGAGGGIMRAANEGSGRERSFGINIRLPFERRRQNEVHPPRSEAGELQVLLHAQADVREGRRDRALPRRLRHATRGLRGATLLQTGRARSCRWSSSTRRADALEAVARLFRRPPAERVFHARPRTCGSFKVTDDVEEAIAEITTFYRRLPLVATCATSW